MAIKDVKKDIVGQSEDALQQKCYLWFHNTFPNLRGLFFAVPNGGHRDAREAKRLNLTGVVSGVSDTIFLYRSRAYFIEFKRDDPKAVQSKKQEDWQELVERQGFEYFIVRTLEDFKRLINMITDLTI